MESLRTQAKRVVGGQANEEAYVSGVVHALLSLDPDAIPRGRDLPSDRLVGVAEFRIAPHGGFRHHDHRDYNGVLLVMEGHVRVRNFDILGPHLAAATGGKFLIRETVDKVLGPGEASTLTSARDNVHELMATSTGCRLLDVFTVLGPNPRSIYLDVSEKPVAHAARTYEAHFAEEWLRPFRPSGPPSLQ